MADKDLTVEEILALCRQADGEGGGVAPAQEEAPAEEVAAAPEPAAAAPASPVPKLDPSKMSVEDMLAAARASAAGESATPASAPAPAPVAAKPAAPAAPKKEAPAAPTGPRDTASILAAARKAAQRGPQSVEDVVKSAEADGKKPAAKPKIELPPVPRKEDFLPPKPAPVAAEATDRRGFFSSTVGVLFGAPLAVGFTSIAITSLLWVLGLARFMFPNVLTEPPTKFKVGFPDSYAPGQVEAKYKAQFGVWVVRYEYEGEAQIYALKSVCTHLGCTPNWLEGEQKFKCPCHGSGFYKDGVNFEGPAPRPLERYAIRVSDDGQLEVDKSTKFNEELGQWADSNSYVSV